MARLAFAAAVLVLLWPADSIAGGPVGPMVVDAAYRAQVDERGVWRLESDGGTVLAACGLRLWGREGYQWQGNARPLEPPSEGPGGRFFHGQVRMGARRVYYWQSLTPLPGGLMVRYAIAASELADTEEVAACFELPLATFAGAKFAIDPARPVAAPAEKAAEPRLIEEDAARLGVERDGLTLAFQRRPAGKIIVQDARHWGNPSIEVQLYARRAAGDPPGWRTVSFAVWLGKAPEGPVVAAVVPGKAAVGCHEAHEAEVQFWAPYDNPFDPAQVAVWAEVRGPSGAQPNEAAPRWGFFTRDYARSQDAQGAERLEPVGLGRWRVRITPVAPGAHVCLVKVRTPGGTAESKPFSFSAAPSPGQSFLHPPRTQAAYLERASGEPALLIGHNYCWPPAKEGTFGAEAVLQRMGQAGINATRLWLCSWGIRLEGEHPDDYRLDDAWRLDHILQAARQRGVYVQLCLDNFQELTSKEHAARNPYFATNGGPCRSPEDYFSHPKAREQQERRLRYLVARYAPFTSLLAWELFNEAGYATARPRDPVVLGWAKETSARLRRLDPHRHPITAGVGLRADWDELWRLPDIDVVQLHTYIPRPTDGGDPAALDAARLVLAQKESVEQYGKPILIAEFGFLGTREFNPLTEADKTGVHLHAALWASALGGCAGTAMSWWWDSYIAERDLYYHYSALSAFFRGLPLPAGAAWTPLRSKAGSEIELVGQRSRDAALLWLQHRENNWVRRVVEGRPPVPIGRALIEVPRMAEGRYRVEWWDTYAGQPITHVMAAAERGVLALRPPERLPDVACKITRLND